MNQDVTPQGSRSVAFGALTWNVLLVTLFLAPLVVGTLPFQEPYVYAWQSVLHTIVLGVGTFFCTVMWGYTVVAQKVMIRWSKTMWVVLSAGAICLFSAVLSDNIFVALIGDASDTFTFVHIVLVGLVAFLVYQLAYTDLRRDQLIDTIAYSGAVMATFALIAQVGDISLFTPDWYRGENLSFIYQRGGELMGNPDWVGQILVVSALLLVSRAYFGKIRNQRLIYGALAVLVSLSTILTLQRAAWVALIVGVAVLTVYAISKSAVSVKVVVVVVGVMMLLVIGAGVFAFDGFGGVLVKVNTATEDLFDPKPFSRITMLSEAADVVVKHPLLGAGPAHFRQAWYASRTAQTIASGGDISISDPHSFPMMIMASLGIPVFSLLLLFVCTVLYAAARYIKRNSDSSTVTLVIVFLMMMLILLVSLSEVLYVVLAGVVLAAIGAAASTDERVVRGSAGQNLTVVLLAVIALGVGGVSVAKLYGFRAMTVAQQSQTRAEGSVKFLEVGTRMPYFAQSAHLGVTLAIQEMQETQKPVDATTDGLVEKALSLHQGDASITRVVARYRITVGALSGDTTRIEQGVSLAKKAIAKIGHDSQTYAIVITGLAYKGKTQEALLVADEYLAKAPKDSRIIELKKTLSANVQQQESQW